MYTLTKINASCVDGKIKKIATTEKLDCDFPEALEIVERYVKDLDNVKRSISSVYSTWESRTEYEPGKFTGVKYKLVED